MNKRRSLAYCTTCRSVIIDYLFSNMTGVTTNPTILSCTHLLHQSRLRNCVGDVATHLLRLYSCITSEQYSCIQQKFLKYYTELAEKKILPIEHDCETVAFPLRISFMNLFHDETAELGKELDFIECELLYQGFLRSHSKTSGYTLHEVCYIWLCMVSSDLCILILSIHADHMRDDKDRGSPPVAELEMGLEKMV